MKVKYVTPQSVVIVIRQRQRLLAGSEVGIGSEYGSGNAVLSREHSFLDDDDAEME